MIYYRPCVLKVALTKKKNQSSNVIQIWGNSGNSLCEKWAHTKSQIQSCTTFKCENCLSVMRIEFCWVTNKPHLSHNPPPFILQEAVGLIVVALSSFLHIDYFLYNTVRLATGYGHFQTIVLRKYLFSVVSLTHF